MTHARNLIFTTLFLCMAVCTAHAELFGDYVSYKACIDCHPDIVSSWKKTPHAHAFATLKEQGEEKQTTPGCVRCHVVDMDGDGGFIDMELTPELADVQCESCHDAGLAHVESQAAEDIVGKPNEAVCRTCHTKGQDKNFDFKTKSQLVHKLEQ